MIVIIDYGLGNLGSILNMLKKIQAPAIISQNPDEILKADKLILPGVGSFDNGMKNISELGLRDALDLRVIKEKIPILGICLGLQLFTAASEEGKLAGLGWLKARTIRFRVESSPNNMRVPHMGWNSVNKAKDSVMLNGFTDDWRFYFVHSYHVVVDDENDALLETHYGYNFVSAVEKDNIFGVQFHPEKSHRFGMQLLKNFAHSV